MHKTAIIAFVMVIVLDSLSSAQNADIQQLIADFIENKTVTLTAHVCWRYGDIKALLTYLMPHLKQMSIYINSVDYYHYFYHLSFDNIMIIDLIDCDSSWNLLYQVNSTEKFRFPIKYLIIVAQDDFANKLPQVFAECSMWPISEVTVAVYDAITNEFTLIQPYRIDMHSEVIWQNYGNWSTSEGLQVLTTPLSRRRQNLNKTLIRTAFLMDEAETWKHLDDMKHPRIDTFAKQNYPTIMALLHLTNCTPEIHRVRDYGYLNPETKTFSGLVRMVELGVIDVSGTSPFFTSERFNVVDFLKMLNKMQMQFLLKKPPLSYMKNIFVLPFSTRVWIALAVVTVLFFFAMYVIMNFESKRIAEETGHNKYSVSDTVLIVFEGVAQQGTVFESKLIPGRILQFIMFLSFMFLYTSFSAYIIVLLQTTQKIGSWKELLDSGIAVGGHNTSYMHVYLSGSRNPIHQQIYKQKIGPRGYYDIDVGMAKVQQGFFALHAEVAGALDYIAEKFTDFEMCQVQILEGFVEHFKGHTAVRKNFPYKEIFKIGLLRIEEFGILRRNFNRMIKPLKCYSAGGNFVSVGIVDMNQALVIYGYGLLLAFLILLTELLIHRKANAKIEKLKHSKKKQRVVNDQVKTQLKTLR